MSSPVNLNHLPQHVAIIMDGNGRWAKQRGLSRLVGHKQGATTARNVLGIFNEYKIPCLTLYAFSTENWNRPRAEIRGLFQLLEENIDEVTSFAQEKSIKLCHLGKLDKLPRKIQRILRQALELTQNNTAMTVSLAFNYGARDEIVEATRHLALNGVPAHNIDENAISQHLYTNGIPDPDLIIRTGGEMRLSNFLLWQAAYAEIYFTPILWPDFDRKEIDDALTAYSQRQRRFGAVAKD